MSDIFELNEKQKKAFNRLKKAYKDCEKEGIFFFNLFGSLTAVDSALISEYSDSPKFMNGELFVSNMEGTSSNYIEIPNEWADDEHFYALTKKGKKVYQGEPND